MNDTTILYYTSNREDPEFERKIQENLLKVCGGLPIISISQKPIDVGKNICVGDVGTSGFNMFRQVLMGCEAATTRFVISAEADCLYPPDYFTFVPSREDICYRDTNLYVMRYKREYVFSKIDATHAQIVGREHYIQTLKKYFEGAPEWSVEEKNFPKERWRREDVFIGDEIIHYKSENPCIQLKTGNSMRRYTVSGETPVYDLPYWGSTKEMRNFYLGA